MVSKRKNLAIKIALNEKKKTRPNYLLEQYELDSDTATRFIHNLLPYINNGVVIDAGCGSGSLTIAAILLGLNYILAVDIDREALKLIRENLINFGIHQNVDIIQADFLKFNVNRRVEGVIMNPPFGTKTRNMDKRFILKAFTLANFICSMHKEGNDKFFQRLSSRRGFFLIKLDRLRIVIKNMMPFHRKRKHVIYADQLLFIKAR